MGGESDPEDAAPADGELRQPDAHSLVALHRTVAGAQVTHYDIGMLKDILKNLPNHPILIF